MCAALQRFGFTLMIHILVPESSETVCCLAALMLTKVGFMRFFELFCLRRTVLRQFVAVSQGDSRALLTGFMAQVSEVSACFVEDSLKTVCFNLWL